MGGSQDQRVCRKESTMWMLVIVLLNQVPGIPTVTMLQTYPTSQECYSERDRIGDEMAKSYPDNQDFEIACRLKSTSSSDRKIIIAE